MKNRIGALFGVFGLLVVMWAVLFAEAQVGRNFYEWGIFPRTIIGLRGILCAPFLHANLTHLVANSVPFLIFGILLAMHGTRVFWQVTIAIIVLGGTFVWMLGSQDFHIGASGLVFGYFGFLLSYGFYSQRFFPLLASIIVALLYGGAIWGVLPNDPHVSWISHLSGFLVGIGLARKHGMRAIKNDIRKQ